jgi:hypothetical protein
MNGRRRIKRCSPTDVLWFLMLFAAGQLGLAIAIEGWLPELRDPRYACRAKQLIRRTTGEGSKPLCIVMLGSSRVRDGFNSSELEVRLARQFRRPFIIYNFGIPGAGPVANLLHFERLIAAGVKPDLLVVESIPILLGGHAGQPRETDYFTADRLWRAELDLVEHYDLPAADLRRDWLADWLAPCHAHRYAIVSRLLPQMLPIGLRLEGDRDVDDSGWQRHNDGPLSADDRRRGLQMAWHDFGEGLRTFRMCEAACRAQRDLLARCREEQIAAAMIWMPEGKRFQSWYPPAAEREVYRHLGALCKEFEVPLINARDWIAEEGFLDSHHLRYAGAVQFTARLEREILAPLLLVERSRWSESLADLHRHGRMPPAAIASHPGAAADSSPRLR